MTATRKEVPDAPAAIAAEFAAVGGVAVLVVAAGWAVVGEGALRRQAVVWLANVAMLGTIWLSLRRRGRTWAAFGLGIGRPDGRALLRAAVQSFIVFIAALAAFVFGAAVATTLLGDRAAGDLSAYGYLQGNPGMLVLALLAVYVVSSFGEEAIYRGFLMTRVADMGSGSRMSASVAVVVSALVFGLIHFSWGAAGIVQTAFMGLALAIAFLLVGRNLWVLVLAHAYLDTLLLLQLYFAP